MSQTSASKQKVDPFVVGIFARCIPLAERDSALDVEKGQALAKTYAEKAIALIRDGFGQGLDLSRLKSDPALAALKTREEFQQLIKDLEDRKEADKD